MPKLYFNIANHKKSAKIIFDFKESVEEEIKRGKPFTSWSPFLLKIPEEIFNLIISKKYLAGNLKNELIKLVRKKRTNLKPKKHFLEAKWDKIDNVFWKRVSEITGFQWKHRKYSCFVNDVTVGHYLVPNEIRISEHNVYPIAEELFHLHYWDIFKEVFNSKEKYPFTNEKSWLLSEIIVEYVLLEDPILSKFWKVKRNYDFIEKNRRILNPIWKNRKDFPSFLKKAHKAKGISF